MDIYITDSDKILYSPTSTVSNSPTSTVFYSPTSTVFNSPTSTVFNSPTSTVFNSPTSTIFNSPTSINYMHTRKPKIILPTSLYKSASTLMSPISPFMPLTDIIVSPTSDMTITPNRVLFNRKGNEPLYMPSINLTYSNPRLSLYYNLNADPKIQKRVTKYIYFKILDKWIYQDLSSLLGYITIKNEKASIISKISEYRSDVINTDSKKNIEIKIKFLEKIFSQKEMYIILLHFIEDTNAEWITLHKFQYYLKKVIKKKIEEKIIKLIKNK